MWLKTAKAAENLILILNFILGMDVPHFKSRQPVVFDNNLCDEL